MSLIKWGMFVVDGRGKVGGHVLTKTRNGATVRTKVTPANPQTAYQGAVRGIFGQISQGWRMLTEAQRDAWNAAVGNYQRTNVFGDNYLPTGKSLFQILNTNLQNVGEALIDEPPTPVSLSFIELDSSTIDISDELFSIVYTASGGTPTDEYLVLEATPPMSMGRYNFSGSYRKFTSFLVSSPASSTAIWDAYVSKFGTPVLGQKISVRMKVVSSRTGQAGTYSSFVPDIQL